jgi:hypothetical protein
MRSGSTDRQLFEDTPARQIQGCTALDMHDALTGLQAVGLRGKFGASNPSRDWLLALCIREEQALARRRQAGTHSLDKRER